MTGSVRPSRLPLLPFTLTSALSGFTAAVVVRPEMHMHNINKMVYVGTEPWHGLGTKLPRNARYDEIAEVAGFYAAEERQLFIENSNQHLTDQKALVRADDGRYLATVGKKYRVVQFADVARTMIEAAGMVGGFFTTAGTLGPTGIREWLLGELPGEILAPRSVNHLRSHLRRLFNVAIKKELWTGPNPIAKVKKADVPKKLNEYLRLDEVPRVLAALEPRHRPLFATAIFTGLRRGELLALRRSDVDLEAMTLSVSRSNKSETTKGGHADLLPIAEDLLPYLKTALDASDSTLVFPDASGEQQRHDVKLQKVLRKAMAKAGIVSFFMHVCRRKKCGFKERRSNAAESNCPKCGKALFVKGIARPVRFHDLRHTTATLLLKAEVPLATVQRVLRHTDPAVTSEIYGHLDVDDMRKAVNKLRFHGKTELKIVG